jgi:transcriptional regulator with XRE-family HTH domain
MLDESNIQPQDYPDSGRVANDISVRLGRRLRVLRTKQGWSQGYLAEVSGINRSHISEIENGKRDIHISLVEMLATSFEMKVSDFLKGI